MIQMQYGVLGTLQVIRDGVDVTPRGKRPRDSLAVLLRRRGDTVSPDTLLELVWAEESGRLDVSAVHTVVARLRPGVSRDQAAGQMNVIYRQINEREVAEIKSPSASFKQSKRSLPFTELRLNGFSGFMSPSPRMRSGKKILPCATEGPA